MRNWKELAISLALVIIVVFGPWIGFTLIASHFAQASLHKKSQASTNIKYVVIIMLENHSFDNYFGRFPGANGVTLPLASDPVPTNFSHSGPATIAAIDGGKMDGFPTKSTIQYKEADIPTYWKYAQQFGLGDNFFSSINSDSTPNHLAMVAAQSGGIFESVNEQGCRSKQNNRVYSKKDATNQYWSYPCYSINSIPQELTNAGISWRYYSGTSIWDAPSLIQPITGSSNDIKNPNQFVQDVQSGNMATVSWITPPSGAPSDHPPKAVEGGENFVAQQVNAIMNSSYWANTAIFVSWDEGGGFYDHVPPPTVDGVGLGARVPLLVISPYAKQGYISHQQGEFSSFDKFIEEDFNVPSLGQRDALPQTGDLMDFFDFSQTPQPPMILKTISYSTALVIPHLLQNPIAKGIYGAINPEVGGTTTPFKFDVIYTLSTTPAIHKVTIDGVDYQMSDLGAIPGNGSLYQYTTTLGVGTHGFSFTFSDTSGTLTIPYNGVPMYGPEVHPFSLSTNVSPSGVLPGQRVTYSATYTSPSNTPPTETDVIIDDVHYHMVSNGGTNYQSGVKYTYSTKSLSIGEHYYTFQFDDGTGLADFGGQPLPAITPITLTNSSVNPTSGGSTTVFTFQTTYRNAAGQAPVEASLYVDNVAYPMTYLSGSYSSGAVFQLSKTLPTGNHSFFFVFADSQSSWVDPFAPSTYAGPNVGVNAQPVAPGTLITPDGDQNPDIPLPGDTDG